MPAERQRRGHPDGPGANDGHGLDRVRNLRRVPRLETWIVEVERLELVAALGSHRRCLTFVRTRAVPWCGGLGPRPGRQLQKRQRKPWDPDQKRQAEASTASSPIKENCQSSDLMKRSLWLKLCRP